MFCRVQKLSHTNDVMLRSHSLLLIRRQERVDATSKSSSSFLLKTQRFILTKLSAALRNRIYEGLPLT